MPNVNTFDFDQVATILGTIYGQVTGQTSIVPTTTGDFVSVAQATLRQGVDPTMQAISRVIDKTIFSNRPYSQKFRGLYNDARRWGSHTRKITMLDTGYQNDERITLTDGLAVDQQIVRKPAPFQTNFYGEAIFQKSVTVFRDQLDVSMRGPEEFAQFLASVMQNVTDQLTVAEESLARSTVVNMIAADCYYDTNSLADEVVVHLVSSYNGFTGATPALTWADICGDAAEYERFMRFACARIIEKAEMLTERTYWSHVNPTVSGVSKPIPRHTPLSMQNFYILGGQRYNIDTMVKSVTFHDDYLSKVNEAQVVNYWQAIDTPDEFSVTPSAMNPATGDYTTYAAQSGTGVFAVIFDRDALGYTTRNEWSAPAPFNASGGYTNIFYHRTIQYFNDNTENSVVFLLD